MAGDTVKGIRQQLGLADLLEYEDETGILRLGGERALIFEAVSLGLLRKEIVDAIGMHAARVILTRFGFAHGWQQAESMLSLRADEVRQIHPLEGLHVLEMQGLVRAEPGPPLASGPEPIANDIWKSCFEAELHLLAFGRNDEPVCWQVTGYASGFLSRITGQEVFCEERTCVGKGDAICHMIGRTREQWGAEFERVEAAYLPDVGVTLGRVARELKRLEWKVRAKRRLLAQSSSRGDEVGGIVARSAPMKRLLDIAQRVAKVDTTVLITGESGVGKERLATLIHEQSGRAAGPFVSVNCAAVPEALLESELFGHARGAFTGAHQDRPGLFEAAHSGTLLLDEIGDMPLAMQTKLLRALQQREIRRVGENRNRAVDVRIIAATNRSLADEVAARRMRQDLYYRLRVVELAVPALRERRDDILPLARAFLARTSERLERKLRGFTPAAASCLLAYDWPGNVRELENAVEHAVALDVDGRIDEEDLPEELRRGAGQVVRHGGSSSRTLAEVERDFILAAFRSHHGNRAETAEALGIGASTLYRRLREYAQEGHIRLDEES